MTAVPPRPAAPKCNCGPGRETVCHQFGTEPHFVGCPRWGEPIAAPDATAGDGLRPVEQIADWLATQYGEFLPDASDGYWEFQARELVETALRDVVAAAARDAERVAKVRELLDHDPATDSYIEERFREALDGTP